MIVDRHEEGHTPSLSIFEPLVVETGVERAEYQDFGTSVALRKNAPIEFRISGASADYVLLPECLLCLKVRILKSNGDTLGVDDEVSLLNFPVNTMFRQVDVSLNQQIVSPNIGTNYMYKCIFDIVAGRYEGSVVPLQAGLFFRDISGDMQNSRTKRGGNKGVMFRANWTNESKICDLQGPLFVDICQQYKYIPNGVEIDVKLYPNSDAFNLFTASAEQYQLEIQEAVLRVCKVKVSPMIITSHAKAFEKSPAIIEFTKSDIKTFSIPTGAYKFQADDIFQSLIPSKLFVALTSSSGYSGNYNTNPFDFKHYNLNFIQFTVDGKSVPGDGIKCNFAAKEYITPFLALHPPSKKRLGNRFMIGREDFANGYAIYCFDVNLKHDDNHSQLVKRGHTRLQLSFANPLPESATVLVYAMTPSFLQIDKSRNVIL